MLIFDENDKQIIIDDVEDPVVCEYFWVLDLSILDYTLSPIVFIEEICCPTLTLDVYGFRFNVPASWHILVFSTETSQLDVVTINELSAKDYTVLSYGINMPMARAVKVKVVDYLSSYCNCMPSIQKHEMLCHPVGPDEWINITPSDSYNKYLKELLVGDIIG